VVDGSECEELVIELLRLWRQRERVASSVVVRCATSHCLVHRRAGEPHAWQPAGSGFLQVDPMRSQLMQMNLPLGLRKGCVLSFI
jgi:hypothetical protein